jgi:parvulin-like peptidyl-prolyl isomerase
MEAKPFITVDGESISLGRAFRYLQAADRLDSTISAILRQHLLEKALQTRPELAIAPEQIHQVVTDFRLQNQLNNAQQFQQWLTEQELDETQFRAQVLRELQIRKLKETIAQSKLQEYFIERKLLLDQVVLSRIAVSQKEMAEELKEQLSEGANFEDLARDYSRAEERFFNGMMGLVSRGELPDVLRSALDLAAPGDVVGPFDLEDTWMIFRLEKILPASLGDPQVRQTLQNELFDRWFVEQLQGMNIEINLDEAI